MAVGESKKINGSLTLEDRYQTTIYDDILEIINATITLNDPAGEIFTDKGNDTVTVSNSTITNNSETGAELMFSMGSDNDSLTISNSTLNVNTFMGSGNDTVTVSGTISSTVTINNQFSLGAGDDTLTLKSVLAGPGNLVFGDGNDTLVFDGGHLLTTGSITGLTNLTVTGNTGTLGNNLTLSGSQNAITLNGNLTGTDSYKVITVSDSTVTFKTANNVKTNVVYSVSNVIFNHVDGGTLEIAESSYWAFSADYSTVTLHDTVLRSNGGGFYGTETDWIISNSDISNNTNGVNLTNGSLDLTAVGFSNNNNTALKLSGTALTGKDVSFTSNANGALDILHANAVLDDARFAKNHTNASCISTSRVSASVSAFGGAIRQTAGNMILNNSYFSGNSANVDVIASNSDYAYSFSYASASAYAFATATATVYGGAIANSSGDLIFSGSANYFSDNSANANVIAKAYAIASVSVGPYDNGIASAYAFVSATATATAYGGAIANSSGDLIFSSSANYFSGNSANAKIIAQAIPNARSSGYVYSYPTCIQNSRAFATATATAYGGAIANCSGDLIFSGSANYFSDNCANANVIAVASGFATAIAYGGAIAHSDGVLKLNKASFDGNYANVSATAAVRDTAAVRGKAYGGAIAANNSILNLTDVTFSANSANATAYGSPSSVVSAYSTASVTAYGGAVYISNSTMEYVVTENECIENIGNNAQKGGFIYLDGVSEATFKVDGSLIVGDSTGMDSIAGSETSTIIKTGSGKWTVNSDISEFTGYWNLNEGILKLDRIARDITLDNWTIGVDAELHLSELNDSITMNVDKKIGTIDLGGGSDTIDTGGYHLSDGLLRISTLTLTGGGRVSSEITNRTAGAGFDLILDDVTLNSIITGGSAADKITITQSSTIGGVLNLGNGANTITANSGTETVFAKSVILGTGADTLTFSSVVFQDSLTLGNGKNSFSAEDSAKISGAFSAGTGDDTLSFNSVEFGNSADLGDGVNSLTATGNAKFSGTLSGGSGDDTFDFSSVTFNRNVNLGDGTNKLTATTAIINGNLTAGSGNDTINLKQNSELHGNIALGGGKNYIYVTQNLTITDGFTLDSDGETHLIVYNNASLSSNSLNVYDPENSNMVSVTYDWSDVEGLDKVRLLVSSDATFETFEFTVELYNQSKEFTLNVSDNYFIQFQAQDEDGWSHRILDDTEAPDQVTGFTMDGTTALWSDTHDNWGGNGVKQYNIQVSSDANFNSVIGSFTATDNSYDFSSFADGNYFIRIQAEDYTGNKGDWSDAEKLLIDNNAPTKPANVTGKVSLDSITVNWSPASDSGSGLKEYKIEFSTSSTFSSITHSATLSGTSYTASDLADGTYYFRVSAVDNVNNVSAWSTVSSVIVDTTAPQAASNVKATQNSGIVTLSWDAASDAGVGVKEYIIEYSTDNSFSSITGTRTVSGTSCSINGLADGNYCFRVQAVDKNGNAASWSNTATVIVDSVPPAKPTASADITSATNKDVTVSAVFSSDSVVKEYSLDNRNWYAYTSGVVMSNNGTVYFRGKDEAGNYSAVTSYEVTNIDKVAPAKPTASADITSATNKDVTVSAVFSSDSVVKEYSMDNRNWYAYSSGVVMSDNGTVYFRGKDEAGNYSAVTSYEVINIDKVAPTFDISRSTESLTNQNVILTVSAKDSASGIKSIQYSFNNSIWMSGSTVNVDSNKTVYFKVTDNAGNVTEHSVVVNNIDKTAPAKPTASADITSATNKDVTVSAVFSSDSVDKEYSLDNRNWYAYSSGVVMSNNGTVYFRGKDEAGNYSAVTSYEVTNIDKVAPTKPEVFASTTAPTNKNVTVSAEFSLDSIKQQFSYDNQTWYDYESGIVLSRNGVLYFRGIDAVGNVSEVAEYTVDNIDKIAPSAPSAFADVTTLTNNPVTVSAAFSNDSDRKQYSFDGYTWSSYTSGVVMESNGTVYFRSFDAAGNVSEITEYIVENIDNIAPAKPTATADITTATNQNVTVSAVFSSDSVVKQYSFDNKTWKTYSSSVVMESNGSVYFRSFDAAGNVSEITEYIVENIDNIAPAKPTATADITAETEDAVTITATFSRDSVVKQYSLDNKNWQNYTSGIVMESNGTVYFRGIDAAGNVSAVTAYEVNNIIAVSDVIGDDLDGNGLADVILVHTKQGYSGAWLTTGTTSVIKWGSLSNVNAGTEILGTGTLYGSGNDGQDIFFADSKSVGAWNVVDGKVTGYKSVMSINSTTNVLGLGDFNGDGATDILLRSTNGDLGFYNTDGTGFTYLKGLGKEWTVAAIGDLNGDGLDDTVLRHDAGFAGTFLTQENGTVKWASLDTLKSDMDIIGTGDFNGDGVDDVLLQNKSNGWVGAWLVEDGRVDSFIGLCTNKNTIEQIADFNGDGIDDLRVRAGADIGVLYVNGADDTTWQYFKSVGTEWDTSFSALA